MIIPAIAMASASAERIFEILDTPSDVEDAPDATPLPPIRGHVRFEHVSFAYLKRHRVLQDVTFEAQPGQIIALLGATGSGKSSIINLIPRFYDPTEGRVLIDGIDIRTVHGAIATRTDRHGAARNDALCRHHRRKRRLWPPRCIHGRDCRRGQRGPGARLHHAHAGRLRHARRRARHDAIRRAKTAHRHRPRAAQRPAHPHLGRRHRQRGHRNRTADPACVEPSHARAHLVCHRPAPQHRPPGQS